MKRELQANIVEIFISQQRQYRVFTFTKLIQIIDKSFEQNKHQINIKIPENVQNNPYYKYFIKLLEQDKQVGFLFLLIGIIFTFIGLITIDKGLLTIANFAIIISYYYFNGVQGITKQFVNADNKIALGIYLFSIYCMFRGMITSGLILEMISATVLFKPLRSLIFGIFKLLIATIKRV